MKQKLPLRNASFFGEEPDPYASTAHFLVLPSNPVRCRMNMFRNAAKIHKNARCAIFRPMDTTIILEWGFFNKLCKPLACVKSIHHYLRH